MKPNVKSGLALLGAALLSACTLNDAAGPTRLGPPAGDILLASDGLKVAGTGLEIGFGRAPDGAIRAVSRLLGQAPLQDRQTSCGRIVTWSKGLSATFKSRAFTGWTADPGRFASAPQVGSSAGETCPA